MVAELVNGFRPGGRTTSVWQTRGGTGRTVPSGVYVARLEHDGVVRTSQLVYMR